MIVPFNRLNVDISCLGNHELDLGIEHAMDLMKQTNCPWIMTNLVDKSNGFKPIADIGDMHILDH